MDSAGSPPSGKHEICSERTELDGIGEHLYTMGHLSSGVMTQRSARIVRELHDEPHIEGSRLTVRYIKERVEGLSLDPQTVADRHNLDVADVYHALAYYYDHPKEMLKVEQRRQARIEESAETAITGPEDL